MNQFTIMNKNYKINPIKITKITFISNLMIKKFKNMS